MYRLLCVASFFRGRQAKGAVEAVEAVLWGRVAFDRGVGVCKSLLSRLGVWLSLEEGATGVGVGRGEGEGENYGHVVYGVWTA